MPVPSSPWQGGRLLKVIANLMLFAGVIAFAGVTGWLLGLLILNLGETQ